MISRLSLLLLALVALAPAGLAEDVESVELRIELPEGIAPDVAFMPGRGAVSLELPRGSSFPMDLAEATGGLVAGGEVQPLADDRMRLTLGLSSGTVQSVHFEPGAVVVRLGQRFAAGVAMEGFEENLRYTLGPYDLLNLMIYNHPDLSGQLSVSREGNITAPFIGEVMAAGLTPQELAEELTVRLGREYLVDPEVDVSVEKFRSQWVMVNGEVRNPGRVFLTGGTTLKEAISDANGFIETSGTEILISRELGGEIDLIRIDREAFENGEVNPQVEHGDIVTVKGVEFAYLQGEIRNPTRVKIENGLTLMQALSMAGGLTEWANRKSVKILSPDGDAPRVLNLKDVERARIPDPELRGGDVIVVQRRFF